MGKELLLFVNLEIGLPSVVDALHSLHSVIGTAKTRGFIGVEIVHGFSNGTGPKTLKGAIRAELDRMVKDGSIAAVIQGEEWNIFNEVALRLVERYPSLRKHEHFCQDNLGITIALFGLPRAIGNSTM
jgi:hypothetical protein